MSAFIIYPQELFTEHQTQLKGIVKHEQHSIYFYILNDFTNETLENIGICNYENKMSLRKPKNIKNDIHYIELNINNMNIDIHRLIINYQEIDIKFINITFVEYNRLSILKSKLLNFQTEDSFQSLYKHVKDTQCERILENENNHFHKTNLFLILIFQKLFNFLKILNILRFSSSYQHFVNITESILWLLNSIQTKRNKLKILNFLTYVVLDILVGVYLLNLFHGVVKTDKELYTEVSNKCEYIVGTLHDLIVWLQGNPAGLKLNHPLTYLLGKFFIYHIQLWWSFLVLSRPFLELMYQMFLLIGYFGFTSQLSILADLLTLASFHVYCVYVYAARLYNIQLHSLLVLSRVFIGKKRNPEPGKVDSVPYTTEQLFIGTIAFTVLLFLLPTTLVYYVVFSSIRLCIIFIEGLLIRLKVLFQTLPIYVIILYILNSPQTTSTVKLTPQLNPTSPHLHIKIEPVQQSLLRTTQMTIPDPLQRPSLVLWSELVRNLLTGKLIYPI